MQKYYSGGLQMNNEVERYVGELRELREENDSLKINNKNKTRAPYIRLQ